MFIEGNMLEEKAARAELGDVPELLQQCVHPQLLLDGKLFSCRLYVVVVGRHDVFLSREGLLKVAAEGSDVTNSGFDSSNVQLGTFEFWC